jgi:hypothetical protein
MVATDSQVATSHEQITDFTRPQRSRYAVAKIDDALDIPAPDVGEHSFERR